MQRRDMSMRGGNALYLDLMGDSMATYMYKRMQTLHFISPYIIA